MHNILLAQIIANLTGLAAGHKGESNQQASTAAENGALISHYTTDALFKAALDNFIGLAVDFIQRDDVPEVTPEVVGEPVNTQILEPVLDAGSNGATLGAQTNANATPESSLEVTEADIAQLQEV